MIYLKGGSIGLLAVAGCVALFTGVLAIFHYDARALIGAFWFISLPMMLFVFAVGFYWPFRKRSGRHTMR